MRVGYNPVKVMKPPLTPPHEITAVIVTFIPYLSGYYEESLEVLKLCLESMRRNTSIPFDLVVFDNASCTDVREYLEEKQEQGFIQYLIFSEKNLGIPGAWNFALRATPGQYLVFSDYDIYFHSDWLEVQMELMHTFPNVGMVTGIPVRSPIKYSTNTLKWARHTPDVQIEKGILQDWDVYWTHAKSTGYTKEQAQYLFEAGEDIKISYKEKSAFIGAGHFQFISPRKVLDAVLPVPYEIAMGNERYYDKEVNNKGFLRLTPTKMYVEHMGNTLPKDKQAPDTQKKGMIRQKVSNAKSRFFDVPIIKKILLFIHGKIFRIYYRKVSK